VRARLLAAAAFCAACAAHAQTAAPQAAASPQSAAAPTASASATATASPRRAVALDVDQAIARALANQPVVLQAEAAVEAARARVGQAQSAYYPSVSASTSYTRVEPDQSLDFAAVLPPSFQALLGGASLAFSLFPVDNWDFHVGLNQVIFQFGKRGVQVQLAQSGVSSALIGVEQIRMSLAYQAATGFYTVLYLRHQLAALQEQGENLQEHLQATRIKAETGAATRYDELSTEVRVDALQSQLIEARNQLRKQEIGLAQVLGLEEGEDLVLDGDFPPTEAVPDDPQSLVSEALSRRHEVRQAMEAEGAAELAVRLARAGAWPTVSAHGSLGYKNGLLPDIGSLTFNWLAGVQVSVPIFQGFLVTRQGDEAEKKLLAARDDTAAVRRNVTTQVLQAVQDLQASHEQVQSAQTQLDQTREMREVVKLQYDLGMLTNLEYLDAQAALERAQLGSLQAKYREVLSRYALGQATGAVIGAGEGQGDRH
jgi:outer membrane protein